MNKEATAIFPNWEDCEYVECTYEECDIGYKEYTCNLTGDNCCGHCPLECTFTVTE